MRSSEGIRQVYSTPPWSGELLRFRPFLADGLVCIRLPVMSAVGLNADGKNQESEDSQPFCDAFPILSMNCNNIT